METGTLLLRAQARITESHLVTDAEMVENHQAASATWLPCLAVWFFVSASELIQRRHLIMHGF